MAKLEDCTKAMDALMDSVGKLNARMDAMGAMGAKRADGYSPAGGFHNYLVSKGYTHKGTESRERVKFHSYLHPKHPGVTVAEHEGGMAHYWTSRGKSGHNTTQLHTHLGRPKDAE
jgi:hypothetical protein